MYILGKVLHRSDMLVIAVLLFYGCIYAQIPTNHSEAEQLKSNINRMTDNQDKALLLLDLAEYVMNVNIDSAIAINNQAFDIAHSKGYYKVMFRYYSNQSFLYNLKGEFEKGLSLNLQGLKTAKKIGDKSKEISILGNIGISYSYLNQYDQAIEYLQKSLLLAEDLGDILRISKINSVLGGIMNNMSKSIGMDSLNLSKALSYYKKSLKFARQLKDSILISDNLNGIANTYCNLEQTLSAKPYILESIEISEKIGLKSNYAFALATHSKILRLEKKLDKAIAQTEKAFQINREIGSSLGVVLALKELALNYETANKYDLALEKINLAESIATENNMEFVLDGIYINKAHYLYNLKDYKRAYEHLLKGHNLGDSLRGIEIKTHINELEKKYETIEKEQKILKLTQRVRQNTWTTIGLIGLILALFILAYIWLNNVRYKNKILEQEKEKIQKDQKIQATASIIQGQEEERHRLAKDLHDGLGGILSGLRYTLDNVSKNLRPSTDNSKTLVGAIEMLDMAIAEMRKVSHNMMPESLKRFGLDETLKDYVARLNASLPMKIHYQSYYYHKSDQALEINIYRILQEIINNAVKHAEASDLFIQLDYKDENINITAEDNGKGFDTSDASKMNGMGLKNIANRVKYMNGVWELNSTPGQGTLIVIEIKNSTP